MSTTSKGPAPTDGVGHSYPQYPGIDARLFDISEAGLTPTQRAVAMDQLKSYLATQKALCLGYQSNQTQHYSEELSFLLDMHANNIGDPFVNGNFTLNTKVMERAVLDYLARLWHAPVPSRADNPESYWGYILSMGSTEGNVYGLYNARDYLAGKRLYREPDGGTLTYVQALPKHDDSNAYTPVAFFSEDTHYSIIKVVRTLAISTFFEIGTSLYPNECPLGGPWPAEVPSTGGNEGPGSVDVNALVKLVEFFAKKGYPPLIVLNYGSTFKGAYDDVRAVGERLLPILTACGLARRKVEYDPNDPAKSDWRTGYWIHVDGALGATYMPFLEMAWRQDKAPQRGPDFDFRLPFVHSLVTSCHKWPGAPVPGGVYMTLRKFQIAPPDNPEYIGSPDTTFSGSRTALTPAVMWTYFARTSHQEQIDKVVATEAMAQYAYDQLSALNKKYDGRLWVERTPLALSVRFRQPNAQIVFRYTLSCETLCMRGEERSCAHIYLMESVTRETIDKLIAELSQPDAFNFAPLPRCTTRAPSSAASLSLRRLVHVPHRGRGFR